MLGSLQYLNLCKYRNIPSKHPFKSKYLSSGYTSFYRESLLVRVRYMCVKLTLKFSTCVPSLLLFGPFFALAAIEQKKYVREYTCTVLARVSRPGWLSLEVCKSGRGWLTRRGVALLYIPFDKILRHNSLRRLGRPDKQNRIDMNT